MAPDRHTWDPRHYLAYSEERARPFVDLLARVRAADPVDVVDLGCGPGNLTRLLTEAWPTAGVRGVDSSAAMIDRARRELPGVEFEEADLRDWVARGDEVDLLVSNATLQWLPDHLDLLPALAGRVRPGGWLAVQVPANFDQPSHTIRTELAATAPYADHLREVTVPASHPPDAYLDVLARAGLEADVWETTYFHVLTGDDPVFAWVSGTGARPTLQALPEDLRPGFEEEFRARLRAAYPDRGYGVVLPFRRIFAVGHRGAR
ncbi:methyltransferase domain-containing protein [Nocardioides sp. GXQ0305]|uniref:methyltransferase domain-containing protein n=1 Tax=Nocardioides sp. GXQ0305 TaxID=3423912 RepID=UPI003D7DCD32